MIGMFEALLLLGMLVLAGVIVLVVLLVIRAGSVKCVHCLKRIPKGARVCHHCQRNQSDEA